MKNKSIITDQKAFFNQNALAKQGEAFLIQDSLLDDYINAEQKKTFQWLSGCKKILDYGCGVGTSIQRFHHYCPPPKSAPLKIIGVDIAEECTRICKKQYPKYTFYTISDNKIPQIPNGSADGCYMLHVLHHAEHHDQIFRTISQKLKKGGRLAINDLSSNNIIIKLARNIFTVLPLWFKKFFSSDLVVNGSIPQKYKVDINQTIQSLTNAGFTITEIGYGHLFFFLFCWIENIFPLSKIIFFRMIFRLIIKFEKFLLKRPIFQKYSEIFYIFCVKK